MQLAAASLNRWSEHVCNSILSGTACSRLSQAELTAALKLAKSIVVDSLQDLQTACKALLDDESSVTGMRMSGPSNDVSAFVVVYRLALTLITFASFRHRCVIFLPRSTN
jgi:phage gp37-like protein